MKMIKFSKNTGLSHFITNRPVEADLFPADRRSDRQTDITKLIVAFRNIANVPKNEGLVRKLWQCNYLTTSCGGSVLFLFYSFQFSLILGPVLHNH
jgi:hypothetical protein